MTMFEEETFSDLEEELLEEDRKAAQAASKVAPASRPQVQQRDEHLELDEDLSDAEDLNLTITKPPAGLMAAAAATKAPAAEASGSSSYSDDYGDNARGLPTSAAAGASHNSSSKQTASANQLGGSSSKSAAAPAAAGAAARDDSFSSLNSTPSSSKRSVAPTAAPHAAASGSQQSQASLGAAPSTSTINATRQRAATVVAATSSCGSSRRSSEYDELDSHPAAAGAGPKPAVQFAVAPQQQQAGGYEEEAYDDYEEDADHYNPAAAAAAGGGAWQADTGEAEGEEAAAGAYLVDLGEGAIDYNHQEVEFVPPTLEEQLQGSVPRDLLPRAASATKKTSRSRFSTARPASASATMRRGGRSAGGEEEEEEWAGGEQEEDMGPAYYESIPVAQWDASMVCDWLATFGMQQYRKKFLHNLVTGKLLPRLTEGHLKADIGIGPLGHRTLILDNIQELLQKQAAQQQQDEAAAAEGGSSGGGGQEVGSSRRGRPSSAPVTRRPRSATRRSASPATSMGDGSPGALGPAQGRQTVYEQRAKLLFELERAQARAASVSANASQVGNAARLAAEEVARLRGALVDLERKNKGALRGTSGSLDSQARIPWQPVGQGTKASDPRPQSRGRPWDPPETDLTFQPAISPLSRKIMAGGGGSGGAGFLERLSNDLKKRHGKMRELKRKYDTPQGAEGLAAARQKAEADLQALAAALGQRWGVSLTMDQGQSEALDAELNDVISSYAKELQLEEAAAEKLAAAPLATKISHLAGVMRTLEFMDRYRNDLKTRGSRQRDLERKWFTQTAAPAAPTQGTKGTAGAASGPKSDAAAAAEWFAQLGWPSDEGDDCESLVSALLRRAAAYKEAKEKLVDKEREKAPEHRASTEPDMDWTKSPWSSDGLTALVQPVLEAAAAAAASSTGGAGKGHKKGLAGAAVGDALAYSVRLLAGCRPEALRGMEEASGMAKKVLVYRNIRTQRFLDFTVTDLAARSGKLADTWAQIEAQRRGKVVSKERLDAFYARLQADAAKRKEALDRAKHESALRQLKALQASYNGPAKGAAAAAAAAAAATAPAGGIRASGGGR